MTTIDHQQAAIDEVAKAIDTPLEDESWGEFTTRVTAAATPHLRAEFVKEAYERLFDIVYDREDAEYEGPEQTHPATITFRTVEFEKVFALLEGGIAVEPEAFNQGGQMAGNKTDFVNQVTTFLRDLLNEATTRTVEFGLSDFLTLFARAFKITFEDARERLYLALDARQVELTPQYMVRLVAKDALSEHQQAAVEAGARMLNPDAWEAYDRSDKTHWERGMVRRSLEKSDEILTAATPHLRAAWAAELDATFQSGERWNETYRKGLRSFQYEKAYLDGAIDIIALLKGGGE